MPRSTQKRLFKIHMLREVADEQCLPRNPDSDVLEKSCSATFPCALREVRSPDALPLSQIETIHIDWSVVSFKGIFPKSREPNWPHGHDFFLSRDFGKIPLHDQKPEPGAVGPDEGRIPR